MERLWAPIALAMLVGVSIMLLARGYPRHIRPGGSLSPAPLSLVDTPYRLTVKQAGSKLVRVGIVDELTGDHRRLVVIGDVHGCLRPLDALLTNLGVPLDRPSNDTLVVFTGDLVNKGPDTAGVLRRATLINAVTVLGNHDVAVLDTWRGGKATTRPSSTLPRNIQLTADTGSRGNRKRANATDEDAAFWRHVDDVVRTTPPAMLRYLEKFPHILQFPLRNLTVVHGGLDARLPLDEQLPEAVTTVRTLRRDGSLSANKAQVEAEAVEIPWASQWATKPSSWGSPMVVFGHDARRKLQRYPGALGIDTGCVYKEELTAAVFAGSTTLGGRPDLVSVSCKNLLR